MLEILFYKIYFYDKIMYIADIKICFILFWRVQLIESSNLRHNNYIISAFKSAVVDYTFSVKIKAGSSVKSTAHLSN